MHVVLLFADCLRLCGLCVWFLRLVIVMFMVVYGCPFGLLGFGCVCGGFTLTVCICGFG